MGVLACLSAKWSTIEYDQMTAGHLGHWTGRFVLGPHCRLPHLPPDEALLSQLLLRELDEREAEREIPVLASASALMDISTPWAGRCR